MYLQGDGAQNSAQLDLASLGGVFIVLIGQCKECVTSTASFKIAENKSKYVH